MGEVFKLSTDHGIRPTVRKPAGPGPGPQPFPREPALPDDDRNRLDAWKKEIYGYYGTLKQLADMDATDAFIYLSQFSARASEMRAQIGVSETKRESAFRIRIIDPFIEECERQFKIHSRIQAIREMDARLAGGSFA